MPLWMLLPAFARHSQWQRSADYIMFHVVALSAARDREWQVVEVAEITARCSEWVSQPDVVPTIAARWRGLLDSHYHSQQCGRWNGTPRPRRPCLSALTAVYCLAMYTSVVKREITYQISDQYSTYSIYAVTFTMLSISKCWWVL